MVNGHSNLLLQVTLTGLRTRDTFLKKTLLNASALTDTQNRGN